MHRSKQTRYSITSSARASSVADTSMPSAFVVVIPQHDEIAAAVTDRAPEVRTFILLLLVALARTSSVDLCPYMDS